MEGGKDLHHEEEKVEHRTLPQKKSGRVTTLVAIWISMLHDILSSHHRANGKSVHKFVGEIL